MINWIDCGTYWLNTESQLSENWKKIRNYRATMSKCESMLGLSIFDSIPSTVDQIIGNNGLEKTQASIDNMEHGIKTEPEARKWYEKQYQVKVREVGIAIPKWDVRIGASVDGQVLSSDGHVVGIIEIKCPKKMYSRIDKYIKDSEDGQSFSELYHEHIYRSHYMQMQGNMAITAAPWCDYIVYCSFEGRVFVQRISFNHNYWNKYLYPKICEFTNKYLNKFDLSLRIDPPACTQQNPSHELRE